MPETLGEFEGATTLINSDINGAVNLFTETLSNTASCFSKERDRTFFANEWFDRDCQEKRRQTRKALRTFVHSRQNSDRDCYCALRKEYKQLLYSKEREYKTKCRKELVNSVNDSREFWENVKKFARKDRQIGDISEEQWLDISK